MPWSQFYCFPFSSLAIIGSWWSNQINSCHIARTKNACVSCNQTIFSSHLLKILLFSRGQVQQKMPSFSRWHRCSKPLQVQAGFGDFYNIFAMSFLSAKVEISIRFGKKLSRVAIPNVNSKYCLTQNKVGNCSVKSAAKYPQIKHEKFPLNVI